MIIQTGRHAKFYEDSFAELTILLLLYLLLLIFALLFLLSLNRFVNFSAMNRNPLRGCYAKTNLVTADIDNSNLDVVANHNRLIFLSA